MKSITSRKVPCIISLMLWKRSCLNDLSIKIVSIQKLVRIRLTHFFIVLREFDFLRTLNMFFSLIKKGKKKVRLWRSREKIVLPLFRTKQPLREN